MPSTTLTVTNQLLSSTTFQWSKDYRSQIDRPTEFVDDAEKMGMDEEEGGERMIIAANFTRHSNTTQLSTGYDAVDLAVNAPLTPGHEGWYDGIRPVVISGHEERINRGAAAKLKLAKVRYEDTVKGLELDFQLASLQGGMANYSDLRTFNGADDTTGFLEAVAYGSQTNVVHNLSKATYSTSVGWQNQFYDCNNSASTLLLQAMYDTHTRIKVLCSDPGKLKWYISIATANNLKRALNTNERYLSAKELDGGRRVMMFDGTPISEVKDLPSTGTNSTLKPWGAMLVSWGDVQFVAQKGFYMKDGSWFDLSPSGQEGRAMFRHLMGQWRARYLAASGVIVRSELW